MGKQTSVVCGWMEEMISWFLMKRFCLFWLKYLPSTGKIHIWFLMLILMTVNNCRMNEPLTSVGTGHPLEVLDRVWVLTNSVREDSHSVLKTEDEGLIISTLDWNHDSTEILLLVNPNSNDITLDKCKKGKISCVNIMNQPHGFFHFVLIPLTETIVTRLILHALTLSGLLKLRRLKTSSPLSVLPSVSSMIILLQWAPTPASVEFSNWNSKTMSLTESDKTPLLTEL